MTEGPRVVGDTVPVGARRLYLEIGPRVSTRAVAVLRAHGVLIAILVIQAGLTLRLSNTAFNDEATYLNAGNAVLAHLLHGTPLADYAASFSGAPFIYPPIAALVARLGGLWAVRALSAAFMLAATGFVFGFGRRQFNWTVGIVAAATFSVAASTLFLGNLATYDAMAVGLLSFALWLLPVAIGATGWRSWGAVAGSGMVAALAGVTKYAALLYLPGLIAVAFLTAVAKMGALRSTTRVLVPMVLGSLGLLGAAVWLAPSLLQGLHSSTTARALGTTPESTIVAQAALYIGGMLIVAFAAVVGEALAEVPLSRWVLGVVLALSGLLAPIYQMYLHTNVSLQKHAGYGLLFVAPMVGVATWRAMVHWRRRMLVPFVGLLLVFISLGANTSETLFDQWPNTTSLIHSLAPMVRRGHEVYLVEEASVPQYYFGSRIDSDQWVSTYFFTYEKPATGADARPRMQGALAYKAAIADSYFAVIALSNGPTKLLDVTLERAIRANRDYKLVARVPYLTSFGYGRWKVWERVAPAVTPRARLDGSPWSQALTPDVGPPPARRSTPVPCAAGPRP
jgi:hypothetical protein